MALIIEDGTGKADAQAYADAATVTAYHTARANAAWTGTDAVKEAAILRAMTFLDSMNWHGYAANAGQALEWPRACMEDRDGNSIASNVIPAKIVHALAELALREIQSAGSTLPDVSRGDVFSKISIAGAVSVEVPTSAPVQSDFPIVWKLLKGLIHPAGSVRLII